ncbi:MAG: hypothetical protein HYZ13_03595 [Acidobacteria bacterium]|nr:hypothetical protein [Acidobacteriota bacterium]
MNRIRSSSTTAPFGPSLIAQTAGGMGSKSLANTLRKLIKTMGQAWSERSFMGAFIGKWMTQF